MNYGIGRTPVLLPGVHLSPAAIRFFESGEVARAHVETLVTDSVAKRALGYPNYVVMGVELKNGERVSVIPRALRSAFVWRGGLGLALTAAGLALLNTANTGLAFGLILVGSHVLRTALGVPHKAFWGHFPDRTAQAN